MAKGGRPITPDARQAAAIVRLERRHVERLDAIIRERSTAGDPVLRQVADRETSDADRPAGRAEQNTINFPHERRRLLGDLIDYYLSDAVIYPTEVRLLVPDVGTSFDVLSRTIAWERTEGERVTRTAPVEVQVALRENQLRHLQRKSPAAYLALLTSVIAQREEPENDD